MSAGDHYLAIILGQLCACTKSTWPNKYVRLIGIAENAISVTLVAGAEQFEVY